VGPSRQLQALTCTALDDVQRRRTGLAAPQPPGRTAGSLDAAVDEHVVQGAHAHLEAQAAAVFAGPATVLP
jgi:hypothetical protein